MSTRCFPVAGHVTATLGLCVHFAAPVVAQQTSTPITTGRHCRRQQRRLNCPKGAADILKLARAEVSDDVTVALIQNGDRRFN